MLTQEQKLNNAYWERNQLVLALTKLFPSYLMLHPKEDTAWNKEWRVIVCVFLPNDAMDQNSRIYKERAEFEKTHDEHNTKTDFQLTWHIHDHDVALFDHLEWIPNNWDGHSTAQKYMRLRALRDRNQTYPMI